VEDSESGCRSIVLAQGIHQPVPQGLWVHEA